MRKGSTLSDEHKRKISASIKFRYPNGINNALSDYYKKGGQVWNKGLHPEYMLGENHHYYGKKFSDEHKAKLSKSHLGIQAKEKNPAWKGGIVHQNRLDRVKFSETVAKKVIQRDNYTCTICNMSGGNLHADHIKSWTEYPELRFNIDNCRTLCRPCHYYITFKRKIPNNSRWGIYRKVSLDSN